MTPEEKRRIWEMRDKIERTRFEAEQAKYNYLRARGWGNTSDTPGCYWMWEKSITKGLNEDGSQRKMTVLVDTDLAIGMQERLDYLDGVFDGEDDEGE